MPYTRVGLVTLCVIAALLGVAVSLLQAEERIGSDIERWGRGILMGGLLISCINGWRYGVVALGICSCAFGVWFVRMSTLPHTLLPAAVLIAMGVVAMIVGGTLVARGLRPRSASAPGRDQS